MSVATNGATREELLGVYGRYYGEEHFAIAFTASTQGDNAKRVTSAAWDKTPPLATADYGAGLIAERGLTHNVAIVLRPSNLIVLECDTEDDLLRIEGLKLPHTLTVRSSKPYKRHFYYRPAAELDSLPYVAFRFESGKLTSDSGRYFLAPPSIHPSGAIYAFIPNHGPYETDIAELPESAYRMLSEQARVETTDLRDRITTDPNAKIREGGRRDTIFRAASAMRRWTANRDVIVTSMVAYNQAMCEPPLTRAQVEMQVDGAMKMPGEQDLAKQLAKIPPDILDELDEPPTISWKKIDLSDPEYEIPPDPPQVSGLMYASKRHVISGPPESAKTLVAYALLLEALRAGRPVALIDFEMGPTAARLLLHELGATKDEIRAVYYVEGEAAPTDADLEDLMRRNTEYVLIDAAASAFDASDLDDNARKDVEKFARLWIRPLWQAGIATMLIDHVTKDAAVRGKFTIGSERKVGSADVHISCDALKPLSRGGTGLVKVGVHKDRPGFLQRPTATVIDLASNPNTHQISWATRDPHPTDETTGVFRPTVLMEKVSRYLEMQPDAVSRNTVEGGVTGNRKTLREAMDVLTSEGYIAENQGPKNARMLTSTRPFRMSNETTNPTSPNLAPTSPQTEGEVVRPTASPLRGAGRTHLPENPATSPQEKGEVYDAETQAMIDKYVTPESDPGDYDYGNPEHP